MSWSIEACLNEDGSVTLTPQGMCYEDIVISEVRRGVGNELQAKYDGCWYPCSVRVFEAVSDETVTS